MSTLHLFTAASLIFVLALSACGKSGPGTSNAGPAGTATNQPRSQTASANGQAGAYPTTPASGQPGGSGNSANSIGDQPAIGVQLPAGAGPKDSETSAVRTQDTVPVVLDPRTTVAPLVSQIEKAITLADATERTLIAENTRITAESMQLAEQEASLRSEADKARRNKDESKAADLEKQAEELRAKQAKLVPPPTPNHDAANRQFESILMQFRQQVKSGDAVGAKTSMQTMIEMTPTVSPTMLRVLQNDLQVLQSRGGHY